MHAKRCCEKKGGGEKNGGRKAFGTLLSFLFLFEGAVGRAEWLSECRMNAAIHSASEGFQHPFKPRALLERAPKALCREPWEGFSCLQYLSRHRERDSFVPGSLGQGESPGREEKGFFCLLQRRFAGSPAQGGRSPRASPAAPCHLLCHAWHSVRDAREHRACLWASGICLSSLRPGEEV